MVKATEEQKYEIPSMEEVLGKLGDRVSGVHDACFAVTPIGTADFCRLVDSIAKYGLLRPVELDKDKKLVDGRSRLQACQVAGYVLMDSDFQTCDSDPWAIAESNSSRRHLTKNQRVVEAVRLLKRERELAAARKRSGSEKKQPSKGQDHGTSRVPRSSGPKKRAPRATQIIAAQCDLPRPTIEIVEKVLKKNPEIAQRLERDEIDIEQAAQEAGVLPKKSAVKKKQARDSKKANDFKSGVLWSDETDELKDLPVGCRQYQCRDVSVYQHLARGQTAIVFYKKDKWWWYANSGASHGTASERQIAEAKAIALIAQGELVLAMD